MERNSTGILLIDVKEAFDYVSRNCQLHTLKCMDRERSDSVGRVVYVGQEHEPVH